mmetsp:Transcript_14223/g.19781  ORF Transcript_14223/g.19781 Transcript_14223/m.19781 type:complete len:181 (+) Transcript_14223:340-882(+)
MGSSRGNNLMEALLADKTGSVLLPLTTPELRAVAKKGEGLIVRNANIRMKKKTYLRLHVTKWGLVERYDPKWGYPSVPSLDDVCVKDKANMSKRDFSTDETNRNKNNNSNNSNNNNINHFIKSARSTGSDDVARRLPEKSRPSRNGGLYSYRGSRGNQAGPKAAGTARDKPRIPRNPLFR